jgi:hypothetical protein|tara:strand:- start:755 stop:1303 length:549 start_codon:yes stop_codon:yes gene_type:complete
MKHPVLITIIIFLTLVGVSGAIGAKIALKYADKTIKESHLVEENNIAENKGSYLNEEKSAENAVLELETSLYLPLDPNAYPDEKRLHEIWNEMYTISKEVNFYDTQLLLNIANHESEFRQFVRGDDGHARGLFQIHDIHHPEITDAQADSIDWSTRWAIQVIVNEKQWAEWYNTMLKISDEI